MTVAIFVFLLTVCSLVTSLITEGVKKLLDGTAVKYSSNILALIMAIIVGVAVMIFYYLYKDMAWTVINIIFIFLMVIANWLGATLGYDKVKQTIIQITTK